MVIWQAKYPEWNKNLKHKRRLFIEELGLALVSHQLDFRSKNSKFLNEDIRNAMAVVGYPVVRNAPIITENSTQAKRKRCSFCDRSTDKKTSTQCFGCSGFVCTEHSVKRSFCKTCCK